MTSRFKMLSYCYKLLLLFGHVISIAIVAEAFVFAPSSSSTTSSSCCCNIIIHATNNAPRRTALPLLRLLPSPESSSSESPPSHGESTAARAIPAITEKMLALTENNRNVAIVIDVENVRGTTDFALGHADFLDGLTTWASRRNRAMGRTIAVVDHGGDGTAHLIMGVAQQQRQQQRAARDDDDDDDDDKNNADGGAALCVGFAGPNAKADDVIARDVKWLLYSPESTTDLVLVVTADRELMRRCRSAARSDVGSTAFDSALRRFADERGYDYAGVLDSASRKFANNAGFDADRATIFGCNDATNNNGAASPPVVNSILQRFVNGNGFNGVSGKMKRGGKMKRAKKSGRKKSRAAKKQLQEEKREADDQLEDITCDDTDTRNTTIEDHNDKRKKTVPRVEIIAPQRFLEDLEESLHEWLKQSALTPKEREKLVLQWRKSRGREGSMADETTEDRIVLAERLRMQLELTLDPTDELSRNGEQVNEADEKELTLVNQYAEYVNSLLNKASC